MHSPACTDDRCAVPDGLCHCGCGTVTRIAAKTEHGKARVKGRPYLYSRGHNPQGFEPKETRYVVDDDGCWIWQLSLDRDGYGYFRRHSRQWVSAHRWYFEEAHGSIPPGLQVDHLCRVRNCVNPAHMELVTAAENTRRRDLVRSTVSAGE